jgi:RND family efflux transporter MFP subunit
MKQYLFIPMILALLWACESAAPETESAVQAPVATNVEVAPVLPLEEAEPIITSGLVAAKEEINLAFKLGGVIKAVYVDEGQRVRKGQVLAVIDPVEIDAQVAQARSALEKAARDLERGERLYRDTVITLEQVQNLSTAKEVAEAGMRIATFNQRHTNIVATSNGTILRRMADGGEVVSPGQPVLMMASDEEARVIRVGLADVDIVKLQAGDRAEVFLDALPGEQLEAQVTEVAAAADLRSGTFEVEFTLDTRGLPVKNGFVARVHVYPSAGAEFLRVPMAALVEADAGRAIVYTPDSGFEQATRLALSPYRIGEDYIAVPAAGYPDLQYVITEGARYIKASGHIHVTNALDSSAQAMK